MSLYKIFLPTTKLHHPPPSKKTSSSHRQSKPSIINTPFCLLCQHKPDNYAAFQMKNRSTSVIVAFSTLVQSSWAFSSGRNSLVKIPSFVQRPLTSKSKALNMVRTSGLEIREEGATPTSEYKIILQVFLDLESIQFSLIHFSFGKQSW